MDIPHRVASSAHVSHLALQSFVPAAAHQLCWWWVEQSQGLHQLCRPSCACTDQPSGVKRQSRAQCASKGTVHEQIEDAYKYSDSTVVQGPHST